MGSDPIVLAGARAMGSDPIVFPSKSDDVAFGAGKRLNRYPSSVSDPLLQGSDMFNSKQYCRHYA